MSRLKVCGAIDREKTGLLTVKNNVNAFHDNERTYAIQSRYNSSAKKGRKTCFRCYFEANGQNYIQFPLILILRFYTK